MELRHLRYFVAVAEEMNFGRAAQRLAISQPPLSQQVKDLEHELGAELIDRSRRRIRLTHAGALFLEEARLALSQAEKAARTARRAQRGEIGTLSVGFVGSATYQVLPEALRSFRERYPDVELRLRTMHGAQQVEAFREGRIQVGVLRPPVDDYLATRTLLEETLVAALPADHPLARSRKVGLSELAGEHFVLAPRTSGPATHDRIVGLCRRAGFSPDVAQESAELQTVAGLVAAGMGVALLVGRPEHLLRHRGVAYLEVTDPGATWELAAAWRKEERSPTARAFVEMLGRGPSPLGDDLKGT